MSAHGEAKKQLTADDICSRTHAVADGYVHVPIDEWQFVIKSLQVRAQPVPKGCICPGDATPMCRNQLCPRAEIRSFVVVR